MFLRAFLFGMVIVTGCLFLSGCSGGGDEKPKKIQIEEGRIPVDPNAKN